MRYYIGFILSILGIVLILFYKYPEFSSVLKAKESYNLGDYKTAAKNYKKLNLPKAKYNEGVANYKDGNFSESLQNFKDVKDDNLSFERLYNLGNTYANLHDFNKSILSFKKALEIKDDNDTRFNLELVEKIKDQNKTQNNQNSNQNSDKNKEQNDQNNSEQNSQKSKDKNNQNENQQNNDKQNNEKNEQQNDKQNDNKSNKNQEDKNNQENKQNNDKEENKQNENSNIAQKSIENEQKIDEQKEDENKENQNVGKQVENKKDDKIDEIPADIKPISDMEEAKWQKALEHRNIGTFLMPIGEKNHKSEDKNVKPW